jgi:mRNA-degrading endonuclease toxin of MazEF toxin-antitoxin module
MVAPITTTLRRLSTTVLLYPRADGVEQQSAIVLDNVMTIRVERLEQFVATLRPERVREVDQALRYALGLAAGEETRQP